MEKCSKKIGEEQMAKTIHNIIVLSEKDLKLDLKVGDTILFGKFKNKKGIVKGFGTNDKGQPTIITDKKEFNLLNFRIEKLME